MRLVQVRVHVLHLVAARTERVADEIGAREADREHVGAVVFAELQRLARAPRQTGRGTRRRTGCAPTARSSVAVGLVAGAFQHVREAARPSRGGASPTPSSGPEYDAAGRHAVPGLAEVGGHRVGVDERLHRRHRLVANTGRGLPAVERLGQPGDRVAAVAGEHDRAARLERQRRRRAPFAARRIWSVKVGTCRRYALSPPVTGDAVADVFRRSDPRCRSSACALRDPTRRSGTRRACAGTIRSKSSRGRRRSPSSGTDTRPAGTTRPGHHPLQAAGPLAVEAVDVVGAHLIDDDDRPRASGGGCGAACGRGATQRPRAAATAQQS